jgi:DNA-binding MarR family transcriptional regulator
LASSDRKKLIEQILEMQRRIQRQMRNDAPDAWLALNLTIAQLKTLFYIDFEGTTNVKNLASALGVTSPNVTGIIARLVAHNLVSREYSQSNRRMQVLQLTPKGARLVTGLKERTISHFSRLLEQLEVDDLAALAQGLTAMNQAAERSQEATRLKGNNKEFSGDLAAV